MIKRGTKEWASFVFGMEMQPCPSCGSYHIGYSMPIKMAEPITPEDTGRQILGKWARAIKSGSAELEGPVRMVCRACGHRGPSMDCTGRTSDDVGRDKAVAAELKRLWNEQHPVVKPGVVFAVVPGFVRAQNDGQRHFITGRQLMRLYGVPLPMCIEIAEGKQCPADLYQLHPRYDGNYSLPREMRDRVNQYGKDSTKP